MNAIRGLVAVIGALAAFRAIVLIWGFAAGYPLLTRSNVTQRLASAVRSAVASLPPRPLDE